MDGTSENDYQITNSKMMCLMNYELLGVQGPVVSFCTKSEDIIDSLSSMTCTHNQKPL